MSVPDEGLDPGADSAKRMVLVCGEGEGGQRLDLWLATRLDLSRARIQGLLVDGKVLLNGQLPRKSEIVEAGASIEIEIPPPRPLSLEPEELPVDIVYQDEALLVVDKAAGMVVHPSAGHRSGTLVNALLFHVADLAGIGGRLRPGIVHRLDKDTSGLMVVAKTDRAHQVLSDALRRRLVRRIYRAAIWGRLPESPLTIDAPIGRDPKRRKRMAVVETGRSARTKVRHRESWPAAELVDVKLETGRTHQIRVHLAHLGHPVVGDATYGAGAERGVSGEAHLWARELARRASRQFLHAAELSFEHPVTGEPLSFRSVLPQDLAELRAWAVGGP